MIYPDYIKGTSLIGYFNQMIAVNAFPSRYFLADKHHVYQRRNNPVYISPFLTETYSAGLGEMIGEILPPDIFDDIKVSAAASCYPFDAGSPVTYDILFEKELKYCPECLAGGEHYFYQQLKSTDTCGKHGVQLKKGCPICGESIQATIEVSNLDAFSCPVCGAYTANFREPVHLVCMLEKAKKNEAEEPEQIRFSETAAHLTAMENTESLFYGSKFTSDIHDYMNTGIRPEGCIEVEKGKESKNSLLEAVIPFTGGKLSKDSDQFDILEYADDSEAPMSTPEQKAGAYLARKLLGYRSPRRLGIEAMTSTRYRIARAIKETSIKETDTVTNAVLKAYAKDMYEHVLGLVTEYDNASLLLITSDAPIQEIRYAMMVLEDEKKYYIYLYKQI